MIFIALGYRPRIIKTVHVLLTLSDCTFVSVWISLLCIMILCYKCSQMVQFISMKFTFYEGAFSSSNKFHSEQDIEQKSFLQSLAHFLFCAFFIDFLVISEPRRKIIPLYQDLKQLEEAVCAVCLFFSSLTYS